MKTGETEILYPLKAEDVRCIGETVHCDCAVLGIYEGDHFLVSREVTEPSLKAWIAARDLKPLLFDFTKNDKERSKVLAICEPEKKQELQSEKAAREAAAAEAEAAKRNEAAVAIQTNWRASKARREWPQKKQELQDEKVYRVGMTRNCTKSSDVYSTACVNVLKSS